MKRLRLSVVWFVLLLTLTPQGLCEETTAASPTAEPETEAELKHLTVTSIITKPWLFLNEDAAEGNDRYIGFIADLVKEVAERSKFSYTLTQVIDNKYGTKAEGTNTWDGMIGELIKNDAQMAAAPLSITHVRTHVVDFSIPWMNVSLAALVPANSGIKTLEDLVDHPSIKYGTVEEGANKEAFRFTKEKILLEMWSHIGGDDATNVLTFEDGVRQVKQGNYSFILENPSAEYYSNSLCSVSMIETTFLPITGYGFAFQKGDSIVSDVDEALENMREDGTTEELYSKWFRDIECSASALTASLLLAFLVVIFQQL